MFNINNPVKTYNGNKVTILHILDKPLRNRQTIVGIVHEVYGDYLVSWYSNGKVNFDDTYHHRDLVNAPETVIGYTNEYFKKIGSVINYRYGSIHSTYENAVDSVFSTPLWKYVRTIKIISGV